MYCVDRRTNKKFYKCINHTDDRIVMTDGYVKFKVDKKDFNNYFMVTKESNIDDNLKKLMLTVSEFDSSCNYEPLDSDSLYIGLVNKFKK